MKYSESKIKALLYKYLIEEHPFKSDGSDSPYALENYEGYIAGAGYAVLENYSGNQSYSQDILLVVWDWPECHDVFIIHSDRLEHVDRADF